MSLRTQKNIMEHWPAPCTNSNDYCCYTYGHKSLAGTFSNISNPSYLDTGLQQRTL